MAFKDLYERQNNKIMKITNSIQNKITSFQKLFSKENKEEELKNANNYNSFLINFFIKNSIKYGATTEKIDKSSFPILAPPQNSKVYEYSGKKKVVSSAQKEAKNQKSASKNPSRKMKNCLF